jgi:hypothetical protein
MSSNDQSAARTLAAATCALLGTGAAVAADSDDESQRWAIDSAVLYYGETDNRVQDISASIFATRDFDDDRKLGLSLTADTLTGASASGAIALDTPQTFTSPSGNKVYTTAPGEIPLDDTFLDTRFAATASWTQPLARLYTFSAGVSFSTEYDYTHVGANVSLARDFNKRNTTVFAGFAWSQDEVDPVGGAPIPLSEMLDVGDHSNKLGTDSKDVIDVLVGLTQVLGRNTILRVNYSLSDSSGYLNDPYKIVSVVDPLTGDTVPRTPPTGVGPTGLYLYESRPDSRLKHSVYSELKHAFGRSILNVGYRFMTDDWGIESHTADASVRWPIGSAYFIEPQLRYYVQAEADFYRSNLRADEPLPEFASADFRLGAFDAVTLGVRLSGRTQGGSEWNTRLQYYMQSGEVPAEQVIGNQAHREQYPDLSAVILQFGYKFKM